MIIAHGGKIHVITRRNFERDLKRHFAGTVVDVSEHLIRVRGYAFVFDEALAEFVRREDVRDRLVAATDAGVIINILPSSSDLESLRYEISTGGRRVLTDGADFTMNVSEFSSTR